MTPSIAADARRVPFFISRSEQAGLRLEAQRAAAQGDVALRVGNLDALFEEEAADVVIDGALDDEVAARAVCPDEEAEVERVVAELCELYARLRLFEEELHALGGAKERARDVFGVRVVGDADGDADARAALAVRPVEEVLVDELRVGDDGGDVVVGHHDRGAQIYAAHTALGGLAVGAG